MNTVQTTFWRRKRVGSWVDVCWVFKPQQPPVSIMAVDKLMRELQAQYFSICYLSLGWLTLTVLHSEKKVISLWQCLCCHYTGFLECTEHRAQFISYTVIQILYPFYFYAIPFCVFSLETHIHAERVWRCYDKSTNNLMLSGNCTSLEKAWWNKCWLLTPPISRHSSFSPQVPFPRLRYLQTVISHK